MLSFFPRNNYNNDGDNDNLSKDNHDSDNDDDNLTKHNHKTIAPSNGWKLALLTEAEHNNNDNAIVPTTTIMIRIMII